MTLNPRDYANKFREELITDLELSPGLCCPNCVITYIDGDREGCCFYSFAEGSTKLLKKRRPLVLNCVFDFEAHGSSMKEVIGEWIDAVLKEVARKEDDALLEKWKVRFAATPY